MLDNTAKLSDIITELQNLEGINQKADLVSVIGSPAQSTDTIATLIADIQSNKNNLATNLTNKGQSASGTNTLANLINLVNNLADVGSKRYATGTFVGVAYNLATVSGLAFKPSMVTYYTSNQLGFFSTAKVYFTSVMTDAYGVEIQKPSTTIGHNDMYSANATNYTLNNDGFSCLPIVSGTFNWKAWE